MKVKGKYIGLISSDWNECLAPCGPFDPIAFAYPELEADLYVIFRSYTNNQISLGEAGRRLGKLLPLPVSETKMDAYLEASFVTYRGVRDLIQWCTKHHILFMINTTGMQGYFQRAMAKDLLPQGIMVAANPMISYPGKETEMYEVREIEDKAKNTAAVLREYSIPSQKLIIMGDSGGDGPHFEWGAKVNAFLIGSMTKPSLENYCLTRKIKINFKFGISRAQSQNKDLKKEMQVNFMDLSSCIQAVLL